jgi:hypothetical protein
LSFLYPNLISLSRPGAQSGEGAQPYGGATQAAETVIATGIACNIELRREGQRDPVGLPADGTRPTYDIRIPLSGLAKGTVKLRDICTDETGLRYQVLATPFYSLGYTLRVELKSA